MISSSEIIDTFLANSDTPSPRTLQWLLQQGVASATIERDGDGLGYGLGAARVSFDGRGYFDFDPAGEHALVVVARGEHRDAHNAADLIAFTKDKIGAWLGRVALLGEHEVGEPLRVDPLVIHKTPLDWLRAGRRGDVILHPGRARFLIADKEVLAADVEHGLALQRDFAGPTVTIRIPRSIEKAAA